MPLVSIIIPCYRQAHYLPQAVQSALEQTLQDVEVNIVDDGSPDEPLERLGALAADPRVVPVRQTNRGLPLARNAGVEMSRSPYLVFLDADDWLAPEFCERLSAVLTQDEHWGFAYCDIHQVFEADAAPPQNEAPYSVGASRHVVTGDILPSLLIGGYFPPNSVMVPRGVLDRVGLFDAELGGHADWDLWLRIAAAGYPARYVDERLAYYRLHGGSMSRDLEHMRATRLRALRKLLGSAPDAVACSMQELSRTAEEQFHAHGAIQQELRRLEAEAAQLRRHQEKRSQEHAAYFRESQAWIGSLEEAKHWNELQAARWKAEADRLNGDFRGLQAWSKSLEEAKHWNELQAAQWQAEADRLKAELESRLEHLMQLQHATQSLLGWWRHRRRNRKA